MELIFILLGVLFLATLVMPWVNRHRVLSLRDTVNAQQEKLKLYERELIALRKKQAQNEEKITPEVSASVSAAQAAVVEKVEVVERADVPSPDTGGASLVEEEHKRGVDEYIYTAPSTPKEPFNFEKQFGAKLPVWVGGIALALGAFYLVKYSIDNNLLSPAVRILFGEGLGIAFLFAARWIREKDKIANGVKIAQSLSGAGIAALYISTFAATSLYHFAPQIVGLGGMAVITAVAVTLSLRHGAPIALLGLVGGFITPALLSYNSDIPTPVLFLYLYIIFAGLMAVIKEKRWWGLSLPAIIGTFLWVLYWIAADFTPDDTIWIGLFLLAVSATVVAGSRRDIDESVSVSDISWSKCNILNYLSLSGAIVLMGTVTAHSGFGYLEWGLFGMIALGGIVMAYFKSRIYGFVPWILMAVNAVMLVAWDVPSISDFGFILCVFAALYMVCGYLITWKSALPSKWVGLMAATSVGYYLLAYFKITDLQMYDDVSFLWGGVALALAGLFIWVMRKAMLCFEQGDREQENVLGIASLMATVFITLALTIELEREFLSVAVAAEVLAVAWISTRIPLAAFRLIAKLLSCVFGFLLIPQILLLLQLTAYSLVEVQLHLQESVPIVDWPLFQLGIPAAMFVGAAYYLRYERDDRLVRAFELVCLGLVAVMGYYLNRHAFHVSSEIMFKEAGFFERNVMTNILFVYGLSCFYLGRRFERIAFSWAAMGLCAVALFRVIYFDVMMYNPLWTSLNIRGVFLANELVLAFGLPAIWAWALRKELSFMRKDKWCGYAGGAIFLLVFMWLNLNVRFAFHGADLSTGVATHAETYAYSALWLLLGVALLVTGVWKNDKMIRYASLAVMILAVGKVFLYDAAELDGLYRVFSFLGLGLSLLGLSYFYTRFVFKGHSD
ncbi:MAG: DUF2339 domain-containing protein [Alphaproteobacteria bacterium]